MRRGVLALALALVACSSGGGGTPTKSPSPSTAAQRFLSLLRTDQRAAGIVAGASDADLLSDGRVVCDILAHPKQQNYSYDPLDNLVHSGMDFSEAAAIVWAAKRQLCPVKSP